ncbi:MAG TPA: TlpA disulfide reductase family protein [Acidobacteriaceae bacterium]
MGATGFAQQQFTGHLRPELTASNRYMGPQWPLLADSGTTAHFDHPPAAAAIIHVGTLYLANRADLNVPAALVKEPGQLPCLYIALNHRNIFLERHRVCFHALPAGSDYSAAAEVSLPLASGPFRKYPVGLRLYSPQAPKLPNGAWPTLGVSIYTLVTGEVALPNRHLLVGYQYDPIKGAIDPKQCVQFADLNGDGKLDEVSERDQGENGNAPIFHIAPLYLRTKAVDLTHHRVTMVGVSAAAYKRFDLLPGATLPDFSFQTFNGRTLKLSDVKGRVILLDFWATWCEACIADLPSQKAVYAKYHARGLEILSLDGDTNIEKAKQFLAKANIPWPQAKPLAELISQRFHITFLPTEILIDAHGRILALGPSELYGNSLATTLDRFLPAK